MELTLQYVSLENMILNVKNYNPCFYGINFAIKLKLNKRSGLIYYNPCFYGINFAI